MGLFRKKSSSSGGGGNEQPPDRLAREASSFYDSANFLRAFESYVEAIDKIHTMTVCAVNPIRHPGPCDQPILDGINSSLGAALSTDRNAPVASGVQKSVHYLREISGIAGNESSRYTAQSRPSSRRTASMARKACESSFRRITFTAIVAAAVISCGGSEAGDEIDDVVSPSSVVSPQPDTSDVPDGTGDDVTTTPPAVGPEAQGQTISPPDEMEPLDGADVPAALNRFVGTWLEKDDLSAFIVSGAEIDPVDEHSNLTAPNVEVGISPTCTLDPDGQGGCGITFRSPDFAPGMVPLFLIDYRSEGDGTLRIERFVFGGSHE